MKRDERRENKQEEWLEGADWRVVRVELLTVADLERVRSRSAKFVSQERANWSRKICLVNSRSFRYNKIVTEKLESNFPNIIESQNKKAFTSKILRFTDGREEVIVEAFHCLSRSERSQLLITKLNFNSKLDVKLSFVSSYRSCLVLRRTWSHSKSVNSQPEHLSSQVSSPAQACLKVSMTLHYPSSITSIDKHSWNTSDTIITGILCSLKLLDAWLELWIQLGTWL